MPSQYALPEHSVSRMLWSVNGSVSGGGAVSPAMVVSPVPEMRPSDVVATAVAKQMERLQILERRCGAESAGHAFTVPVIICEDVDAEQRTTAATPERSHTTTTLTRLSPPSNARRFLQVPGIDVGVERRPPS
ncbi:hypothetical protein HPB52_015818 [Rhipicephalus sanguineus]|uniref:Uncharacterized protein n=1 Tax=Rhipicephalus sanguineus TaxID=34632 RepID=A0A9D4SQE8_RHISA|nr:hypothetical protein HPB52_015818 [Rhipicephalus sanguineus]